MTELRKVFISDEDGTVADVQQLVDSDHNIDDANGLITGSLLYGRASDTSVKSAALDSVTHDLISITSEHHEMHEGDHYFFKTYIVDVGGTNSTTVFSFTTPNTTTRVHARARLTPDADYTVEIHEGATVSGGVPLNGFNNDRDSTNIAELSALSGPTIDVAGDLIWAARNGGGRAATGVTPGFSYEIIAKTDTTYTFSVIKNIPNQPQVVDVDFWWYEHVPKE